jgi:hypothetical protein
MACHDVEIARTYSKDGRPMAGEEIAASMVHNAALVMRLMAPAAVKAGFIEADDLDTEAAAKEAA